MRIHYSKNGGNIYRVINGGAYTSVTTDEAAKLDGDITSCAYAANTWSMTPEQTNVLYIRLDRLTSVNGLGISLNGASISNTLQYSTDNVLDPSAVTNWTTLASMGDTSNASIPIRIPISPTIQVRWIRHAFVTHYWAGANLTYNWFHVYGGEELSECRFELKNDATGTTAEFPITDYLEYVEVSAQKTNNLTKTKYIKNLTDTTTNYTVSIESSRYGGDTLISNCVSLSLDGLTKSSSITFPSGIDAGTISPPFYVHVDITPIQNPADGVHFGIIKIIES